MTQFAVSRLPMWPVGGVPPDTLSREISDWLGTPAMTALVRAFGGEPPTGDTATRLAYLEDFSGIWDARNGGERFDARYVEQDAATRQLIESAALALGLAGRRRPTIDRYDHVLILGGGSVTGHARACFAAQLLATGVVTDTVTGLGSLRNLPVTPADRHAHPDGHTEGDVMLAAVQSVFPPTGRLVSRDGTTAMGEDWWVKTYPSTGCPVSVLAAPSTRPGQRANTADTLHGWAELVVRPTPEDRLLLVTTDLYVPFQHAEAIKALGLPYRCGVDTVGFDRRTFAAWTKGPGHPGELLQEIRSAIRSMRTLHQQATHARI